MHFKRRYLPSLGSFATFETAAKHLSFTLASSELNVTQAAVSQQIRGLEKALGVALFVRKRNGVELTVEGQHLLLAVTSSLNAICDVISEFEEPEDTVVITCSGTNAAIAYWFKPLVARFCATHPGLKFVLLASDEDDTLRNFDEVDISLICGNERTEVGELLYYLFPEVVEPICSPDYLRRRGPFSDPASLAEADLLELHRKHWASEAIGWFPITWSDWFHASGFEPPTQIPSLVSNNYMLLIEAAIAGEGVILGWRHLIRSQVATGKLSVLFNTPLRVDRGNYLKVNKASLERPYIQEFIDFIIGDSTALDSEGQSGDSDNE